MSILQVNVDRGQLGKKYHNFSRLMLICDLRSARRRTHSRNTSIIDKQVQALKFM